MPYSASFRCLAGCAGSYPLTQAIYRCPTCGGLLDVRHDLDALRDRSAAAWMKLFDDRYKRTAWPYGSGVWGKREWVIPTMPDDAIVSMDEGGTNLFWAERYGRSIGLDDVWVKLCGNSHTGSFKDLGMTVLVSVVRQAMREGLAVRAIACASTGDTSASLAAYGAAAGLPVVVLLPKGKVSTAQLVQPIASGALVLALDTDFFDGCMKIVQRLAGGRRRLPRELDERAPPRGPEDRRDRDRAAVRLDDARLDRLAERQPRERVRALLRLLDDEGARAHRADAAPLRRAGREREPGLPRVRACRQKRVVEPQKAKATLASAIQIGDPVSAPRAMKALEAMDGVAEQATEDELCDAAARADKTGMYTCPHTAVALAALEKITKKGLVKKHDRVVVVSTASALKFTEFKVRYHDASLEGVTARHANPPVELPADYAAVRGALERHAAKR